MHFDPQVWGDGGGPYSIKMLSNPSRPVFPHPKKCLNEAFSLREGFKKKKKLLENSNKALPPPPTLLEKKKTKNDLRAMKRILYDMGNFFDANRPSYGLSLFYFR